MAICLYSSLRGPTQGPPPGRSGVTLTERSREELLRPLRTALTDLVLTGLSPGKILHMVTRELNAVAKEGK